MEVVKKVFTVLLVGWLLLIDASRVTGRAPVGFIYSLSFYLVWLDILILFRSVLSLSA